MLHTFPCCPSCKFLIWEFFLVKKNLAYQLFLDKEILSIILHLHEQFSLVTESMENIARVLMRLNCHFVDLLWSLHRSESWVSITGPARGWGLQLLPPSTFLKIIKSYWEKYFLPPTLSHLSQLPHFQSSSADRGPCIIHPLYCSATWGGVVSKADILKNRFRASKRSLFTSQGAGRLPGGCREVAGFKSGLLICK